MGNLRAVPSNSSLVDVRPGISRLLHLGFAFPPGVASLFPGINPAGHALETQMVAELRRHFDVRSTAVLPFAPPQVERADPGSGVPQDLILIEKPPELFHELRSLMQLTAQYRRWVATGWKPDAILIYNLSPIYNHFVIWLQRQPRCPKLILILLDSPNLGVRVPWLKRFRRRFKPMHIPDWDMVRRFDACIGLSKAVGEYFRPRDIPFLWMPGGCRPERVRHCSNGSLPSGDDNPMRFGYFGALASHAGVRPLVETLISTDLAASLEVCGYGKMSGQLAQIARYESRVRFHGLFTPAECLRFGQSCDVLVNPRPASHGNQNNFPSKLFEYALTGRAILTTRLSGVEDVLGPEAFYFDPYNFAESLKRHLYTLAATSRSELRRRGAAIQQRILREFTWEKQGARLSNFVSEVCGGSLVRKTRNAVLAAA
jgi:glycosyltransferase involved in cell wall biosynthesis